MNSSAAGPRLLVIQPDEFAPLDRFAGWLEAAGVQLEVVRPFAGEAVPRTLAADGLIVLGGKMSANDDDDHPWLEDVRALQRDAVTRSVPTLGICLGGQVLAQALGGKVVPGPQGVEAGLVRVQASPAISDDPLLHDLGPEFPVASMHGDMIDVLPEGSVLLGSSSEYPHQVFRAGTSAWGVQFHPEIAPATYAVWAGIFSSPDPQQDRRVADGVQELAEEDPAVRRVSSLIADRFARLVSASGLD